MAVALLTVLFLTIKDSPLSPTTILALPANLIVSTVHQLNIVWCAKVDSCNSTAYASLPAQYFTMQSMLQTVSAANAPSIAQTASIALIA